MTNFYFYFLRLSSLKKNTYFTGWTSSPSSKKAQEALSHGVTSIKSAYSVATSSLTKRVEELRDYQAPQRSVSPASSYQYLGKDDDLASQDSTGSRRQSEVSAMNPYYDTSSEYWNIPGSVITISHTISEFQNFSFACQVKYGTSLPTLDLVGTEVQRLNNKYHWHL